MIAHVFSRVGRWISGALALIAGAGALWLAGRRAGEARAQRRATERIIKKQEEGRDAVADLRGAGRDDLAQRLRDNDGKW